MSRTYDIGGDAVRWRTLVTGMKGEHMEEFGTAECILDGEPLTRDEAAEVLRSVRKDGAFWTLKFGGKDYCEACGEDFHACQCNVAQEEEVAC